MSDDKLKQNHVFVKNNVGSLALHKAKQEIGRIKMGNKCKYCNGNNGTTCYVGKQCKYCGKHIGFTINGKGIEKHD